MDSINPRFQNYRRAQKIDLGTLKEQILAGDRAALSRAITLTESKKTEHRTLAESLLQELMPYTGDSLRVGITGVPGVGKSTFIEAFGNYLIDEQGQKLAVLAVDPSSGRTRGSILGDKTRMERLSQREEAFIRPSPSGGSLGGVAQRTRESILLCEAAGYKIILVETVGVGQSETAVRNMVDFFMLLMLSTAGDELQGIKRGIMEMADLLCINKADDPKDAQVRLAMGEYKRALHLFPPNPNEWITPVLPCSALKQSGLPEIWETIDRFARQQRLKGYLEAHRREQALAWFEDSISEHLLSHIKASQNFESLYRAYRQKVSEGALEAGLAATDLVQRFLKQK